MTGPACRSGIRTSCGGPARSPGRLRDAPDAAGDPPGTLLGLFRALHRALRAPRLGGIDRGR
ncbi:hypothetical protein K523DRAFT_358629 [Schizophyllum commune Tattone D]|nr:hypothetical protein K523DRAFT_358629 [Schizophyllum commune Tattone D]